MGLGGELQCTAAAILFIASMDCLTGAKLRWQWCEHAEGVLRAGAKAWRPCSAKQHWKHTLLTAACHNILMVLLACGCCICRSLLLPSAGCASRVRSPSTDCRACASLADHITDWSAGLCHQSRVHLMVLPRAAAGSQLRESDIPAPLSSRESWLTGGLRPPR